MGEQTKKFFTNLSWSFMGGIGTSIVMLGVNVMAGRYMGPIEYGRYGLVLTISQILMIPIIFGFDVSGVKSIATSKSISQKSKNISNVFYFLIFSSSIIIILFYIFRNFISDTFYIDTALLSMAVLYAVIVSFKSITDSVARGLFLFKEQFFGRILEVGTIVSLFCIFFFQYERQNYLYYVFALSGGALIFSVWLFRRYYQYLTYFDFGYLKEQLSFSSFLVFGTVLGTAFNSLDKVIIVKYLSIHDFGIYMAYFMASTNVIAQATQIFINVLFPQIASLKNGNFLTQIERLFAILFIPGFLIMSFIIWIIITLLGRSFDLRWEYVFTFGLLAVLQIVYTIYASVITAVSKSLYKKFLLVFNLINVIHICFYGLLIYFDVISIIAIVLLFICNLLIVIQFQRNMLKKHFQHNLSHRMSDATIIPWIKQ